MRVEKWNFEGKEVDVTILDEDEIEKNDPSDDFENTIDLEEIMKTGDKNE